MVLLTLEETAVDMKNTELVSVSDVSKQVYFSLTFYFGDQSVTKAVLNFEKFFFL